MPYIRMKRIFLQGLLWLYLLLEFGFMALSLEPGFLDFDNLPDTNFSCVGKVIGGYYADLETNCQMFHVCTVGQLEEPMDIRFLCLNGTVFDQETRVCERIDEVDCSKSEQFYGLNLELYGNTQPAILEGSPETEQPLIIKSSTTTTSTTTSKPKATNVPYYTSRKTTTVASQGISPHHFSLGNSPDIRFNPAEINISLHPGAPPDIRTKQQSYSDNNKKILVTTHSENSDSKKVSVTTHSQLFDDDKEEDFQNRPQVQVPATQKPHSHSFNKNFQRPTPSDINYEFTFGQTESSHEDYHTEFPQSYFHSDFHSDQDYAGHHHNPQSQHFKSSTFHSDFTPTTKGGNHYQQKLPTTSRNYFLQSLKPPAPNQPHHYTDHQTEKPQRLQLPLPLLPTLPPLTFSSPAPFSLHRHIDTKRYTKDHPRIVISASASVSDASGRRLNYSLGTIDAAEFLEQPPQSYDEYKDEDVGLDPFYHDVPKLKRSRTKRQTNIKHTDIIKSEEEAVNVLKFLFDWYKNNERTATQSTTMPTVITTDPVTPKPVPEIEISAEASVADVSKETPDNNFKDSGLFDKNSKFNIIGNQGHAKTTADKTKTTTEVSEYEKDFLDEFFGQDYVNDNFEPIAYDHKYPKNEEKANKETGVVTKSLEEAKSQSLPKDYVDDNIEPIYFRSRSESDKNNDKNTFAETETAFHEIRKEIIEDFFPSANTHLNLNQPTSTGDTETNNIKQNIQEKVEEASVTTPKTETSTSAAETVGFSEPKSEILESVTTEKITIPMRSRNNHTRGRKRYYNTIEKEKEPENKNVVLEKITERAHTAKDDFNYLRTLYKVHTTTPTLPETKLFDDDGITKTQRVANDYIDLKEASPSDKILQTSLEEHSEPNDDKTFQSQDLIPTVTTEASTTSEIIASTTTSETTRPITSTTERAIPSSEVTNPLSTFTTENTSPSSSTSESSTGLSTTIIENATSNTDETIIPSSATTTEELSSNTAVSEIMVPSSTTTIERIVPFSTTTTEKVVPSRRDSRRRGRTRYTDSSQHRPDRRNQRRRPSEVHEKNYSSSPKPDIIQSTTTEYVTQTTSTEPEKQKEDNSSVVNGETQKKIGYEDIVIEENGSNINRNVIPYPVTTEYSPTLPNVQLGITTEQTEFLTLLTLNYKKIFEDISQTAGPISPQVLDPSTLAVTEQYGNVASSSVKYLEDKITYHEESLIPSTTSKSLETSEETIQTTPKSVVEENITAPPPTELKFEEYHVHSENQVKETTTVGKPVTETVSISTEMGKPLETIPTTLLTTEKPVDQVISETTPGQIAEEIHKIQNKVDDLLVAQTTEKISEETKVVEDTTTASSTTELVQEKTEKVIEEIGDAKQKGYDSTPEVTTVHLVQEETQQTTPVPVRGDTSIPKITDIFNFHGTNRKQEYSDVFPTSLVITENSVKSTADAVSTTQQSVEANTETSSTFTPENVTTESYLSTIYVLRTTEKEKLHENLSTKNEQAKEESVERTEIYPSTVLVLRTTETPHHDDETLSAIHQLTTKGLQKLIEEIEENTKSVVANTNIPMKITNHREPATTTERTNQYLYDNLREVLATTERRDDLEELTSLFQYTTNNNFATITPPKTLVTPKGEVSESTVVTSTTEVPLLHSEGQPTTPSILTNDPELMSTSQIDRLAITETPISTTTAITTTIAASRRGNIRDRGRSSRRRNPEARRHRFSTESFTNRPEGRKQTIEEEIIDELAKGSRGATTESYRRRLRVRPNSRTAESRTDAPLQKSASPTQSERTRESLPTTPLSKDAKRFFIFNCFGKEVDKFYPDPRDCRLFHYCTQGYNKNQLIDMKFVCDLNTYFDDVKLICSKRKPRRCM